MWLQYPHRRESSTKIELNLMPFGEIAMMHGARTHTHTCNTLNKCRSPLSHSICSVTQISFVVFCVAFYRTIDSRLFRIDRRTDHNLLVPILIIIIICTLTKESWYDDDYYYIPRRNRVHYVCVCVCACKKAERENIWIHREYLKPVRFSYPCKH